MPENQPVLIHSDRLVVEIAPPGSVYQRTRFDWTGFITQVTLDGKHTFCVPEDYDPQKGTGGVGLCGEFGNEKAIGYAEAGVGELFPKLGIGLLRKPDNDTYKFIRAYEIATPFPIRMEQDEKQATFTVEPVECNGYAARTTKKLRVEGNCLEIIEQLENLGMKPIHTEEYYHNFIGIDGLPLGPEYRLKFPYEWKPEKIAESYRSLLPGLLKMITPGFVLDWLLKQLMDDRVLVLEGKEVSFQKKPKKPFYSRSLGFFKTDQPQWEIAHMPGGVSLRECDDFSPSRVAIWGTAHVISAEVFIDLQAAPGETRTWRRWFEFAG